MIPLAELDHLALTFRLNGLEEGLPSTSETEGCGRWAHGYTVCSRSWLITSPAGCWTRVCVNLFLAPYSLQPAGDIRSSQAASDDLE